MSPNILPHHTHRKDVWSPSYDLACNSILREAKNSLESLSSKNISGQDKTEFTFRSFPLASKNQPESFSFHGPAVTFEISPVLPLSYVPLNSVHLPVTHGNSPVLNFYMA
ncbi:hypothetical protein AVEN_41496-1 [Araneus ventricosus]|uniref:Uncharacterized protein n=1 Tax=Araneus ventricosus TaxID=182803 RepID=A0A4Y2HBV3_ARAVE|nr:hypothetical protein AVEN_41496-1 [Araneus ventricosus]